jgi:phosphoadenosine phosphosulfate reductase
MVQKHGLPDLSHFAGLENASPQAIIAAALDRFDTGEVAAVSSFGADSAVLLHMIARIDRHLPIVFLDTGKHFGETLQYRDDLVYDLGLTDIRIVEPERSALHAIDPAGNLHKSDVEACCAVRKVEPMARGVAPFKAWFTGRKRFQAGTRAAMPVFEHVETRIRINPLANWDGDQLATYMNEQALRENPLVQFGYLSIGCFPCTQPIQPGDDPRAGRWAGQAKTECGIHLGGLTGALKDTTSQDFQS